MSNEPVSNEPGVSGRQLLPPSVVTSVPVGPTARAASRRCGSQAAPERYAGGGVWAGLQVRPASADAAAACGEASPVR